MYMEIFEQAVAYRILALCEEIWADDINLAAINNTVVFI